MSSILPLEVEDISFRYGRHAVLRGVDLRVNAGEVVALLGPNGAGKTTLFRLLTGAEQPDAGTRRFAGAVAHDVTAALRRRFAYLAHQPQVYPLLSARENVELFCDLCGVSGAPIASSLKRLGLGEAIDRRVGTFSRGMAQRVALARALCVSPELFIMDEPFTALDPGGRGQLVALLREQAAAGCAVLVASHDLDAVAAAADRACVLRTGRIVERISKAADAPAFRAELSRALGALDAPATPHPTAQAAQPSA